jgi:ubiquinone biosynthesis protein
MTPGDTGGVGTARASSASRYVALARLLIRHGRSDLVSGAGLDEYAQQGGPDADAAEHAE